MTRRTKPVPVGRAIGPITAEGAARLLTAAADIALVLDADGVVRDRTFRTETLRAELEPAEPWTGRDLADTLAAESRPRVAPLLRAARAGGEPPVRHVDHLSAAAGKEIAVEYAAVQAEPGGPVFAFGRDLRPLAGLQQRLVEAQEALAHTGALQRQAEARFRAVFEASPDPLLLLDAQSFRVVEANPAARTLSGTGRRPSGWPVAQLFSAADRPAVQRFLLAGRSSGTALLAVRLANETGTQPGAAVTLTASFLVEEPASVVLLRVRPDGGTMPGSGPATLRDRLLSALELSPDGFVFTDGAGQVQAANVAFLAMAQLATEEGARNRRLDTWLGQPGVDLDVLIANLRQRGSVQSFGTTLRGEFGQLREVEVSAVAVTGASAGAGSPAGGPGYGFAFRDTSRRFSPAPAAEAPVPTLRSAEQLTELIGRVPLKDLVRDATDLIERLCIEAALELTGDNRAAAAEMLGLSRQSLYLKLRRHGLGDLDDLPDGLPGSDTA